MSLRGVCGLKTEWGMKQSHLRQREEEALGPERGVSRTVERREDPVGSGRGECGGDAG